MKLLGVSSMIFLLVISFIVQWEKEGQNSKDGDLIIYKVDRFTGQRWEVKYIQGNTHESPVFSREQISNSMINNGGEQFKEMEKQKEKLKKIIEGTTDAHEKYNDPRYFGEVSPDSLYSSDIATSFRNEQEAHEEAIKPIKKQQEAYLDASKKFSDLEDDIDALEYIAINKLTSRAWIIRNTINVIRISLIILFLILVFFKWRKTVNLVKKVLKI